MLTAIALAKGGDVDMLKFLLAPTLPRERPIKINLPAMNFADDGVEVLGRIMRAVAKGQITPSEVASLARRQTPSHAQSTWPTK